MEVAEAKSRVDELLARATAGEEIVIVDHGKPVARLGPAEDNPRRRARGMFKGQIWMSDDFNAPLTDDELKEWGL
ncbi:MAG TPA: type II toxin-antitoxin system prevent-host-death family antitoxin [Tepidisphaeraceae bacterium]|jgi:prevent-host-death family protein|nr:type II toxin-antitoxin system prevent-host-death family antitoxin [Tepidisphaeraceae bacterium]